jgi:gluconolactonase
MRLEVLDPRFEVSDPRFEACIKPSAQLERLYDAEGPAYFPAHRSLVWSDIPNDRMLRYYEPTGDVSVFRSPANNTNGHTVDPQGRLVSCEHGTRRVTRTEHDGTITVLADGFEGKRLNSPNDVVVRSDGAVYFTDPSYGIESDYEGNKGESEFEGGACYVFRIDPVTGALRIVADDFDRPNGLAFSVDERLLYVADSGGPHNMSVLDVADDGTLTNKREFAVCEQGVFDGFRLDSAGRIWTSAADGVHCYDPDGTLLGKIHVPEVVANVTWGWQKRNRLYICATTSVYAILLTVNGAKTM